MNLAHMRCSCSHHCCYTLPSMHNCLSPRYVLDCFSDDLTRACDRCGAERYVHRKHVVIQFNL